MKPLTLPLYQHQSSREITKELQHASRKWRKSIGKKIPDIQNAHNAFIESLSGGKMLRGILVKLGYELICGSVNKEIIKPAAAYEILHTSFLIHDDIIDQSTLRRGKPAMHIALGANHYALSQSICLGDLGFFLANQLISESNFPDGVKNKAVTLFNRIATDTILGEILDVELARSLVKKETDVLSLHKMKTALYTIVGPLSLGAIFAEAPKEKLSWIKKFGEHAGIAFQIQDDILGCFGNDKQIGKSVATDVEEGKNTLLISYAIQKANQEQKKILKASYGQGPVTKGKLEQILKIFVQTGSLEYSQMKAKEYIRKAKKIIPHIAQDQAMQTLLNEFTDLLINRQK
jgi:geranylgeranyl diphosphate synthase type I